MKSLKKILIIGAEGEIGSYLLRNLKNHLTMFMEHQKTV